MPARSHRPCLGSSPSHSLPDSGPSHGTLRRRRLLGGLVAAAFLLTSGCGVFRRTSELDAVTEDLEAILDGLEAENEDELLALADSLREQALELREAHADFAESFNAAAMDRQTSDEALDTLVSDYEARRRQSRRRLLETQDELHALVPEDAWPDILEVLNRKAQAVASRTGAGG